MTIAFLGTGRMGTELALHLLKEHDLVVWNRTSSKTERLVAAGATLASSPEEAIAGADIIVTSLFGPDTVRDVVINPRLIPEGVLWVDTTTVSPEDCTEFAEAVPSYVAAPVVGTLGPARAGSLGVYVGSADEHYRHAAAALVAPWADPERLVLVDAAPKAAVGKLLANLALAVSAQGLKEALLLGDSSGLSAEETLDMLNSTGLAFIAGMKRPFVLGERPTTPGDFTADAIAKDARLMLNTATQPLPAVASALNSLEEQQQAGHGDEDFSVILTRRDS
ncbi:NAD(P)-dependent oxidoreductase [Corynebacterium ulcerans]|uniref:NAD(P)-dependent oxidoreductase n=1 Tax=Corynebacterium ulcerans TaxID=65058 RepID=UPI00051F7827|nr:NAD(P)-dependent oxidoreductase [Corynebacterium ulcerans]AIT88308.1 3-hydroxyisobutyrate dehydrogenase [Corynebacterium ulcerans]ALD94076.1 3-hydroxyisobutyrate dehydrogenase [Corynebacterium ulcerans]SQG57370.1 3-hydroxyisobutyrate dehydrogenase [Corynebacterium ulcerans]